MKTTKLKTASIPLNEKMPHTAWLRQSKVRTPTAEKLGAELKCSAPRGPLPPLAARLEPLPK